MKTISANSQSFRGALRASAIMVAAISQGASAQTLPLTSPAPVAATVASKPVRGLTGDLNPFTGDINPFTGDLNPFTGDLNPFTGDLNPFTGDINPFTGDLNPFTGDINAFTGDLNPFTGDINPFTGDLNPFTGDLNPFWGTLDPAKLPATGLGPQWQAIGTYWTDANKGWGTITALAKAAQAGNTAAQAQLPNKFGAFLALGEATWGAAIESATGKSFADGFANPLLAKYGLSAATPEALAKLTQIQRNRFYLDWYDGLMAYSGADRVDHWMSAVNWAPAITQQQGNGADTVIGLVDGTSNMDADVANNIAWSGGYKNNLGGHGVGVASLMVAAHDNKGVMGIAPRARVVAFNPFDDSNTASWADVETGVNALRERGASIINASLGVSGWTMSQEWQQIMARIQRIDAMPAPNPLYGLVNVAGRAMSTPVYVIAAGNDGFTQTKNINWDFAVDPAFLVVGSVDSGNTISSFSNRPGTACLLKRGVCLENNRLMNRFIVAPGEFILVADGKGGVARATGTSFAAPLVSGAIALLHDRWPWLARYPHETVQIITSTARDLGEKGVDPVYGVGLLDVERSQSPIDFNKLSFAKVENGVATLMTVPQLRQTTDKSTWEAKGVFFAMYEPIGATYRDFMVPMSSRLRGLTTSWTGRKENFQNFVTSRFSDWIDGKSGFTDMASYGAAMPGGMGVRFAASTPARFGFADRPVATSAVTVDLPGSRFAVTGGFGSGAAINGAQPGFAHSSDYAAAGGGANPLLGFASGGAFMQAQVKFAFGAVSMGYTENAADSVEETLFRETERRASLGMTPYRAKAVNFHFTRPLGARVTLAVDYARLDETNALLGVQSTIASDMEGGATTDVLTAGAQVDLGRGFTLAATGTQGRTHTVQGQTIATQGAVASSAYSLGLRKFGLASRDDLLALTISQPLRVHSSTLSLTDVQIVDRATGEMGYVSQTFGIGGERRQVTGALQYGASFANGAGRLGFFGKGDLQAAKGQERAFVAGGEVSVRF